MEIRDKFDLILVIFHELFDVLGLFFREGELTTIAFSTLILALVSLGSISASILSSVSFSPINTIISVKVYTSVLSQALDTVGSNDSARIHIFPLRHDLLLASLVEIFFNQSKAIRIDHWGKVVDILLEERLVVWVLMDVSMEKFECGVKRHLDRNEFSGVMSTCHEHLRFFISD